MNASLLSGLTNLGVNSAKYSAASHMKMFLDACRQFPIVLDTVAPIVERSTMGLISREKLRELAEDPNKLDGEINDQLMKAVQKIDLKKILASIPGLGDILNLGKKSLETVTKTGGELYDSGKLAAEEALKTAKSALGLEKVDAAKNSGIVKADKKDLKKTDKKTDPSKPSNKGLIAKIKAFYKARPKTAIAGGLITAYIGLKIVIPLVWKIVKWPFMIVGGLFVGKKAKGLFGKGGGGAAADMMRNMHAAQGPDLTDKVSDAFIGDAKNGDENFLQKGLNLGNKVLEKQIPGWKELGGHKLTNMAKKLAPGKEIPLQPSSDDGGSGGGLFGGGGRAGMNPLAALAGMGGKR